MFSFNIQIKTQGFLYVSVVLFPLVEKVSDECQETPGRCADVSQGCSENKPALREITA